MRRNPSVFWGLLCAALAAGGIYWIIVRQGPVRHALSALKARHPDSYYDLHGNVCEEMRVLERARFAATFRLCEEIDDHRRAKEDDYPHALYFILGFVKDPRSIPWIESRLGGPDERFITTSWLSEWRAILAEWEVTFETRKWLTGADAWAAFFRRWVQRPDAAGHRKLLLRVMSEWFHDPQTVDLFAGIEADSSTQGEDLLFAQLYLQRHERPVDLKRLTKAIAQVEGRADGASLLTDYAGKMRNEEFVPWLVAHADDKEAEEALQSITFVWNLSGKGFWKAWVEAHGKEGRVAWMNAAAREFDEDLAKDELAQSRILAKAINRWNDLLLLPHMTRWAARPALSSEIIGWIDLTYQPAYRERLRKLAEEVLRSTPGGAKNWSGDLPKGLGFPDDPEDTWDRFVQFSNGRI